MFRRNKSETTAAAPTVTKPGGKGRPTPTRREAEAAAKARAKVPRTRKEQMAALARIAGGPAIRGATGIRGGSF